MNLTGLFLNSVLSLLLKALREGDITTWYGCQLWSPTSVNQINAIENIQRKFTKHITGIHSLSYENRLKCLNLYSLQRRRDRYTAIYVWKIMEEIVPNLSPPMCVNVSERRGRLCVLKSVERGHIGTLAHSSFR